MKQNLFRFFIISIILIVSLLFAIPSYIFGIDNSDNHLTSEHVDQYIQNHPDHYDGVAFMHISKFRWEKNIKELAGIR